MSASTLRQLLGGRWMDPETDRVLSFPLSNFNVLIDYEATEQLSDVLEGCEVGRRVLIVSDENTQEALGARVLKLLEKNRYQCADIVLPENVSADMRIVSQVKEQAADVDVIVAVGSGTINDICKYASALLEKPYVICATAPSMNGYLSKNASIAVDGHKKTLPAHLPSAVIMDLAVVASAPERLIQSGYGDLLCRSTAQADWLMSHLVFGTPYQAAPFFLLESVEEELHQVAPLLLKRDMDAIAKLCEALLLSGVGMWLCDGSYPASQAEHMIAHTIDMKYGSSLPRRFHGEAIAVTTVTMSSLQQAIMEQQSLQLKSLPIDNEKIFAYFDEVIASQCVEEISVKKLAGEALDEVNQNLKDNWEGIVAQLQAVSMSPERLQELAFGVGLNVDSQFLGLNKTQYREVVAFAPYTRSRYTFLDLLHMKQ